MMLLRVTLFLSVLTGVICGDFNPLDYLPKKWRDAFKDIKIHPDAGLNIYQFLKKYHYPVQTHWVTTEDGYVLRMHRIIGGQNYTHMYAKDKPVVLLMHGITSSSMTWVNMGPKKGLALALADAGYDVWMGNTRGNTWSRQHVTLDPDIDTEFWDFSFETCGYYDLPAKIDYIIDRTGKQKIFYIGVSQGTSIFFAMAALRPEYNDKIALMTALAPIAYLKHLSSPVFKLAAKYMDTLKKLAELLNIHEIMNYNPLSSKLQQVLAADGSPVQEVFGIILSLTSGFDTQQLNRSILSVQSSNSPAGASIKMIIHFGQEILSGHFRRFDYGPEKNLEIYKNATPPDFNLSAITAPVVLYYGQNDLLAAVKDVERLKNELPNVIKAKIIEYKRWTHMDFGLANDVYKLVNKDVIEFQNEILENGTLTTSPPTIVTPDGGGGGGSGNRNNIQMFVFIILGFVCWIL